jgi:hypothetical protein
VRFSNPKAFLLALLVSVAPGLPAQSPDSPQPSSVPSPNSPAPTKPKKVWTNENVASTTGSISVAGGSDSSVASQSSPRSDSYSNGATILSPSPGSIVHPGEPLHVEVALDPSITLVHGMGVAMGFDAISEIRPYSPYSFTLTVPSPDPRRSHVIGPHELTAMGAVVGRRDDPILASIPLDVEQPDLPLEIFPSGNHDARRGPRFARVEFFSIGVDETLDIYGKFLGGLELDLSESTHLTVASGNPAVARVSGNGRITSVGPGDTMLLYTYSLGSERKQVLVPVHVEVEASSLLVDPPIVDFGNQAVGTTSAPHRITLTNNSESPIEIGTITGGFFRDNENCSNTTLPPHGHCSITVSFGPTTTGEEHDTLYISNTAGQCLVPFFGNGI